MKSETDLKRAEIKVDKEDDRVVVMALRFNSHGAELQIGPTMNRIQHMLSIQMHREMEIAGFAFGSGDGIVSENGTLTLIDLVKAVE